MTKPRLRNLFMVLILVATLGIFAWYLRTHPEHIAQLRQLKPGWLGLILLANAGGMAALVGLYQVLVRMLGLNMAATENMLLSIYSSIANFFGPMQSGPGVRAAYLKAKHHIPVRRYVLATLFAYAVFAILSAFCLLVGARPWWQTLLAVLAAAACSGVVIHFFVRKRSSTHGRLILTKGLLAGVVVFTVLQICFLTLRFYFALTATGAEVSLGQALSYTGAANFALFVSLTPDGIGIREAFLYAAQGIHTVSTPEIVAASLVDRATYVLFLGLLFLLAVSLHAKSRIERFTKAKSTIVE